MDRCRIRHQLFLKPLAVMVLTVALAVIASAQTFRRTSQAYPYDVGGNVSSPVKIILGVLIFGMFFIAFVSLYLRTCIQHSSDETGPTNIPVTNNNRLRRKFPCGLDRSVIESFPVFLYSDVKQRMIGDRALECAVCISEFTDDERLRFLPKCHHVFHPECIDAWLATHTTCPVCRADLTTANVDGDTEFNHELIHVRIDESRTEIDTPNHDSISVEQQQQPAHRLPRSHSTGHSLVTPGENCERFTLRLPVEVQNQIVALRRAKSCGCDVDGNSIKRCGGEGSTGGRRWTPDRIICGRLDQRDLTVMRMPTLEVETIPAESSSSSSTSAGLHV